MILHRHLDRKLSWLGWAAIVGLAVVVLPVVAQTSATSEDAASTPAIAAQPAAPRSTGEPADQAQSALESRIANLEAMLEQLLGQSARRTAGTAETESRRIEARARRAGVSLNRAAEERAEREVAEANFQAQRRLHDIELQTARAELEAAAQKLDYIRDLHKQGGATPQDLAEAQLAVKRAELQADKASVMLELDNKQHEAATSANRAGSLAPGAAAAAAADPGLRAALADRAKHAHLRMLDLDRQQAEAKLTAMKQKLDVAQQMINQGLRKSDDLPELELAVKQAQIELERVALLTQQNQQWPATTADPLAPAIDADTVDAHRQLLELDVQQAKAKLAASSQRLDHLRLLAKANPDSETKVALGELELAVVLAKIDLQRATVMLHAHQAAHVPSTGKSTVDIEELVDQLIRRVHPDHPHPQQARQQLLEALKGLESRTP